jgi:glutathione S-transferase
MRVLHHWILDPFSRCVRIALAEKKLAFELNETSPFTDDTEAVELNPIGGAPVFVDEVALGRIVVSEPRAIMEYLDEVYPNYALMPDAPIDRAEVRWVMGWLERGFETDVNQTLLKERIMMRYIRAGRPNTDQLRMGAKALNAYLKHLEAITPVRPYLAGHDYSLADTCMAAHLSCHDYFGDVVWSQYPNTKEWYVRMKSRPSFREILDDSLEGVPPAPHYARLDF